MRHGTTTSTFFSRFGGLRRSPAIHFGSTNNKRYPPYFPLGAGHNDVVESNPHAYYTVVDNFVRKVTSRNQEGGGGGSAAISRTSVDGAAGGGEETDCSSDFAAPVGGRLVFNHCNSNFFLNNISLNDDPDQHRNQ